MILKDKVIDKYSMLIAFGDRHCRNQDERIDSIILQIINDYKNQIEYILDGGDGIEGDSINEYDKSHEQLVGLQAELNADFEWRKKINKISPKSKKIILECNHFIERLAKIKKKSYFLSDLISMESKNLMRLTELNWELRQEFIWEKKLMFLHGSGGAGVGSQKNIINATRDLVKENNISTVRFHSHTTGYEVSRKLGDYYHAIQLGTLMDLQRGPSYIKHSSLLPNWTNSIGVFYLAKDKSNFFFVPIVIENGITIFNNKLYQG